MALKACATEMSTGLDLDWIRTVANFVKFGLDPGCKSLKNLGTVPDLDWVNGNAAFLLWKGCTLKCFGLHLDLTFENIFGLWLDFDWVLKNRTGPGSQNLTVRSSLAASVRHRNLSLFTVKQRWADCHILRSRSSSELSKLSPSPTLVQKVYEIQNPSPNKAQKINKI